MVLYVGETVTIKIVATNPATSPPALITDATATVERYAVDTDPKNDPAARTVVGLPITAQYSAAVGGYLAAIDTTGFAAGKHPYRARLAAPHNSWEYGSFTLRA